MGEREIKWCCFCDSVLKWNRFNGFKKAAMLQPVMAPKKMAQYGQYDIHNFGIMGSVSTCNVFENYPDQNLLHHIASVAT